MEQFPKSSIILREIILSESSFNRTEMPSGESPMKNFLEIDIENDINLPNFFVSLNLKFEGKVNDVIVLKSQIKMTGDFFIEGEKPDYFDDFLKVNAPAIIFPYSKRTSPLFNK